jgi:hypothetical protein
VTTKGIVTTNDSDMSISFTPESVLFIIIGWVTFILSVIVKISFKFYAIILYIYI